MEYPSSAVGMDQQFVLVGLAPRPLIVAGLDQEFILSKLAQRPRPERVPSTFAASVAETLRVLDDIMRPGDSHSFSVARPTRDDCTGPLVTLPFDRQWTFHRLDTHRMTADLLEVAVFRDDEMIKIHVVIEHDSFGVVDCEEDVNTTLTFQQTLTYADYTELLETKFFEEAELTPAPDGVFKMFKPTGVKDYSIQTSAGVGTAVIHYALHTVADLDVYSGLRHHHQLLAAPPVPGYHRMTQSCALYNPYVADESMDLLTERLALTHIKRPLGATWTTGDDIIYIPYGNTLQTKFLKTQPLKTKPRKTKLPKKKRPLSWRPSPSLAPSFLEI
jgi:hypothetical protein